MTMTGIFSFYWLFISSDRQDITFVWMKIHVPFPFPYIKFVEILLKTCDIDIRFYCQNMFLYQLTTLQMKLYYTFEVNYFHTNMFPALLRWENKVTIIYIKKMESKIPRVVLIIYLFYFILKRINMLFTFQNRHNLSEICQFSFSYVLKLLIVNYVMLLNIWTYISFCFQIQRSLQWNATSDIIYFHIIYYWIQQGRYVAYTPLNI